LVGWCSPLFLLRLRIALFLLLFLEISIRRLSILASRKFFLVLLYIEQLGLHSSDFILNNNVVVAKLVNLPLHLSKNIPSISHHFTKILFSLVKLKLDVPLFVLSLLAILATSLAKLPYGLFVSIKVLLDVRKNSRHFFLVRYWSLKSCLLLAA
jgi:hypothetical protein